MKVVYNIVVSIGGYDVYRIEEGFEPYQIGFTGSTLDEAVKLCANYNYSGPTNLIFSVK